MKNFTEFLTEATMTTADAVKLLGLTPTFTSDELKAAYKQAAIANHPDKGGDLDTMKKINAAYDKLKDIAGRNATAAANRDWWKDARAKDDAFVKAAFKKVVDRVQLEPFVKHFESIFGEKFTPELKKDDKGGTFGAYAYLVASFSTKDKTTVISFRVSVGAHERHNTGLAANSEQNVTVNVSSEIYHNGRKLKLTQRMFSQENDYKVLSEPELLFPRAKLAKKKDAKAGKYSKKDAFLSFSKELNAEVSDEWIRIPLPAAGERASFLMYRTKWGGYATYGTNGLYLKSGRVSMVAPMSIPESLKSIQWLVSKLKPLQKLSDLDTIKKKIDALAQEHKENRETIDPEHYARIDK